MNIAFYIDEMNFRGVANSTYNYALNNQLILKNKSIIFYNKLSHKNEKTVIKKFKYKFKTIGIKKFIEIEQFKSKFNLNFIYIQKSGEKDLLISTKIKTLVHSVYPQKIKEKHGYRYAFISRWLSKNFSNYKIDFVPLIVQLNKTKRDLKKKLNIPKKQIVLGCHGGSSSFNLKFVHDTILDIVNKRDDITFLFLNIDMFTDHKRIIFLKGTSNEEFKKKFLNTCDAMIYGRSLGESYGLACGEFAILNKKIFAYKYSMHKNHIFSIPSSDIHEYSSRRSLFNLLNNFRKQNKHKIKPNKYKSDSAQYVMKKFYKVFLAKNLIAYKFTFKDMFINKIGYFRMNYNYIRHKLYHHYYNLIESRLLM